jgi:predicted AlkP superfamily phosphohydrolase/phosphomutase
VTVYWVVWDAAAAWVTDRLDHESALPALRQLRERGARAAARPPRPNCQTPPSLATLFTGTWPAEHGVTGFDIPVGVTGQRSGFAPSAPQRPMAWHTLAAAGRRAALVHAPWGFGDSGTTGPLTAAVEAYSRRIERPSLLRLDPGETRAWPAAGQAVQATHTGTAIRVAVGDSSYHLAATGTWQEIRLPGDDGFWARASPDGAVISDGAGTGVRRDVTLLARTGVWSPRMGGWDERVSAGLAAGPIFAGEGAANHYRAGEFGPRLAEGGDGSAEEAFLGSIECVYRSFRGAVDAVLDGHDADLVVIYLPMTDEVGHEIVGWCDARSGAHRPAIADHAWTFVRRCYEWADQVLAAVLARATPEDSVLLCADHGVAGVTHLVHLNEALIRAGLAARAADGEVDPQRSAVLYHPANNGTLLVNHDGLPEGIVPADDVAAVMTKAMQTLTAISSPATGLPVVRGYTDGDGTDVPATAGPAVHVILNDDYQPAATAGGQEPVRPTRKSGAHVMNTGDTRLHATFSAVGPGIPPGADLGVIDNTAPARLVIRHCLRDEGGPPVIVKRKVHPL